MTNGYKLLIGVLNVQRCNKDIFRFINNQFGITNKYDYRNKEGYDTGDWSDEEDHATQDETDIKGESKEKIKLLKTFSGLPLFFYVIFLCCFFSTLFFSLSKSLVIPENLVLLNR